MPVLLKRNMRIMNLLPKNAGTLENWKTKPIKPIQFKLHSYR